MSEIQFTQWLFWENVIHFIIWEISDKNILHMCQNAHIWFGILVYQIYHFKTMKNPRHNCSVNAAIIAFSHAFIEIQIFKLDLFDLPHS
jgi:hypothetical protein